MGKWWRTAWRGVPCRGWTGGGEIHPMMEMALWCTQQETGVSVRCATTRGVERNKREVTGSSSSPGIVDDRRRHLQSSEEKFVQPGGGGGARCSGKIEEEERDL